MDAYDIRKLYEKYEEYKYQNVEHPNIGILVQTIKSPDSKNKISMIARMPLRIPLKNCHYHLCNVFITQIYPSYDNVTNFVDQHIKKIVTVWDDFALSRLNLRRAV